MAKASDNVFPRVIQGMNTTDQAAPSDSSWRVYAKANGIFARSSNSIVGPFSTGAGGGVATDAIWTTAGKVAVATGTATATEQYPPGYEFDYVQSTSGGTISGTTEAGATTIVTANAKSYDGSTVIMIECFVPTLYTSTTVAEDLNVGLFDGSTGIGILAYIRTQTTGRTTVPVLVRRRLTPSNASHTYSLRAWVPSAHNGGWDAGAGGSATMMPTYIRQTKV